jgi:hypothetical protein
MTALDIARGSAWLVVAVYVVVLIADFCRARAPIRRAVWTLGAAILSAHILWTMLVVHHGSLQEAYADTALKTKQLIGIPIGAGVYVNFAMLAIWIADALAWWLVPNWMQVRQRYVWPLHALFSFLFINAAIVFASPWGRLVGGAALLVAVVGCLMPSAKAARSSQVTND